MYYDYLTSFTYALELLLNIERVQVAYFTQPYLLPYILPAGLSSLLEIKVSNSEKQISANYILK